MLLAADILGKHALCCRVGSVARVLGKEDDRMMCGCMRVRAGACGCVRVRACGCVRAGACTQEFEGMRGAVEAARLDGFLKRLGLGGCTVRATALLSASPLISLNSLFPSMFLARTDTELLPLAPSFECLPTSS